MRRVQYRPRHIVVWSHLIAIRRLGAGLALLALVVVVGVVAWGHGRSAAAVAAPVSRDGTTATLPARDPLPTTVDAAAPTSTSAAMAPSALPRPVPLVEPGTELNLGEYFVHIPPVFRERMEVLVALHGMGGQGSEFCESILTRTDRERWVVVAPTFAYGDWRDPTQVTREESSRFIPRLHEFLEELPARTGLPLEPKVDLYGYSRGAQLAQRFAMIYPEQTHGVAVLSAGTYTLPMSQMDVDGHLTALRYPFGTADLRERFGREFDPGALQRIPFWVGVGAEDRNAADLPRQWDAYLGTNRVARAEAFAQRVRETGASIQLAVFPGVDHSPTEEMRLRALDFIAALP